MLSHINHPAARRLEQWLWDHPKTAILLTVIFFLLIFLPQWGQSVWSWFRTDAPIPTIAKSINVTLPALQFSITWITTPIGVFMLASILYLLWRAKAATQAVAELSKLGWTVKPETDDTQFEISSKPLPPMSRSATYFRRLRNPFWLHFHLVKNLNGELLPITLPV